MNLMEHNYRDNRDNVLHYRDIGILIIAQPYTCKRCIVFKQFDGLNFGCLAESVKTSNSPPVKILCYKVITF